MILGVNRTLRRRTRELTAPILIELDSSGPRLSRGALRRSTNVQQLDHLPRSFRNDSRTTDSRGALNQMKTTAGLHNGRDLTHLESVRSVFELLLHVAALEKAEVAFPFIAAAVTLNGRQVA